MVLEESASLAGMSAEARAELEGLVGAEGSSDDPEGKGPADGGQDPVGKQTGNDQPPAWAAGLLQKMESLEASNRTLQGQVRAFEARGSRPTPEAEDDPYEGLDLEDPTTRTLVTRLKRQDAEIKALKGSVQGAQVSAAEQAERGNWMAYLEGNATKMGVPFAEHEAALRRLSTTDLPVEGMALLIGAKPSGSNGAEGDEFEKGRLKGVEATARALNVWDEIRAGQAGKADGTLTADKLRGMSAQEFADLNITDEQLEVALNR